MVASEESDQLGKERQMAELLGKALAGVFEQLAEECRARAKEAEAAMERGADARRDEDHLRPLAASAGGECQPQWK